MEQALSTLRWVVENADGVLLLLGAVHVLAVAIVNLTPTPADDKWLGKGYRVVEAMAGIFSAAAKLKPRNRQ